MYKSFRVKNFRCFKDLQINDLGRVNLIAGKNNTGKTALMEAMYLFTKPLTPQVLFHLNHVRGLDVPNDNLPSYWQQFFFRMDSSKCITIAADNTRRASGTRLSIKEREFTKDVLDLLMVQFTRQSRAVPMGEILSAIANTDLLLELSYTWDQAPDTYKIIFSPMLLSESAKELEEKSQFVPTRWHPNSSATASLFSELEIEGQTSRLPDALKIFESDLTDLNLLSTYGQITIWARVGRISLPLNLMGEGINKFLHNMMTMLSGLDYIFIDEIENGIHHSVQCKVWKAIGKLARDLDIQVFATTHSYEMIRAAYEAFSEDDKLDEFRYHRLSRSRKSGELRATTYNELDMEAVAAFDFDHEVR